MSNPPEGEQESPMSLRRPSGYKAKKREQRNAKANEDIADPLRGNRTEMATTNALLQDTLEQQKLVSLAETDYMLLQILPKQSAQFTKNSLSNE